MTKKTGLIFRREYKKLSLIFTFLISVCVFFVESQVKILPLGNSITYDNYVNDNRSAGQRISYRYKLYQLLKAEGLDFDFVGNRDAGNDFFQDAEYDDVAGFPGITTPQMITLVNTGKNEAETPIATEAPGAYLTYYPADIILLHIGTNDLTVSSDDVENLLTRIRYYAPDVIILVAKIINRKTYHSETTAFNNNVEAYVNSLGDPKIIMVDMENGAGINYATDMRDTWHPYQSGYDKMAVKWYQALIAINKAPVISSIPKQITQEGSNFTNLDLKDYVTDADQSSSTLINWTFQYSSNPKINVSLNSGVASVSVLDSEWSGKDSVLFKVTDNGNGAFKESDSTYVVFEVVEQNDPPLSNGILISSILEDVIYTFTTSDFDIEDIDSDPEDLNIVLNSGQNYAVISQNQLIPDKDYTGDLTINVQISDLIDYSDVYNYTLEVLPVNDPPVILEQTSFPEVKEGDPLVIAKSYLDIEDIDDNSSDVDLVLLPGENYSIVNDIIYMNQGTAGYQFVKIQLFDSEDSSEVFDFRVTVLSAAKPPTFLTSPLTTASENFDYEYYFNAIDSNGDNITYELTRHPDFIYVDLEVNKVFGKPTRDDIGSHIVEISASDGEFTVFQEYNLEVLNVNDEPYFTSTPTFAADDYELYTYTFQGADDDLNDTLIFFPKKLPEWLQFDEDSNKIMGYPKWQHADKVFETVIGLADRYDTVFQSFNIFVTNDNSHPVLLTIPNPTAQVDTMYQYVLSFSDLDENDVVQIIVRNKPSWLIYDESATIFYGEPTTEDVGLNLLMIELDDGRASVLETFEIDVKLNTKSSVYHAISGDLVNIYPNPTRDYINVEINNFEQEQTIVKIYNISGVLVKQIKLDSSNKILLDGINPGVYQLVVAVGSDRVVKKLVVR